MSPPEYDCCKCCILPCNCYYVTVVSFTCIAVVTMQICFSTGCQISCSIHCYVHVLIHLPSFSFFLCHFPFSVGGLGLQGKAHFIFTATCDDRQPNLALFVFIVITFLHILVPVWFCCVSFCSVMFLKCRIFASCWM